MNANRYSFCFLSATIALSFSVILLSSSPLQAGLLNASQVPSVSVAVQGASTAWDYSWSADQFQPATDADGGYVLSGEPHFYGVCDNRANVVIEQLQFDPDPFVLNNILVTNTTTTTQIYSVTVGLPTTFGAPNLISGNVRTSAIDGGFDGATITNVGLTSLYQAQIDLSTVATLQDNPFSVVAPAQGSNTASASFGPNLSLIPVASSIGIQLTFSLTAGDTASILSRFDVVVPEPGSFVLCGIGLAFMAGAARRRR